MSIMLDNLLTKVEINGGCLSEDDVKSLANLDRLRPLVVICERGRFSCPAQDAAHFIDLVEKGGEHVRYVALQARR